MTTGRQFGHCDIHFPWKRWANNTLEEQNYEAIEQWSRRLGDFEAARNPAAAGMSTATVNVRTGTVAPTAGLFVDQISRGVWSGTVTLPSDFTYHPISTLPFTATNLIGSDIQPASTGFLITTRGLTVWEGVVHMDFEAPIPPISGAPSPWDTAYNVSFHDMALHRRQHQHRMEFSGGFFTQAGEVIPWSCKQSSGASQSCYMECTLSHIQM